MLFELSSIDTDVLEEWLDDVEAEMLRRERLDNLASRDAAAAISWPTSVSAPRLYAV